MTRTVPAGRPLPRSVRRPPCVVQRRTQCGIPGSWHPSLPPCPWQKCPIHYRILRRFNHQSPITHRQWESFRPPVSRPCNCFKASPAPPLRPREPPNPSKQAQTLLLITRHSSLITSLLTPDFGHRTWDIHLSPMRCRKSPSAPACLRTRRSPRPGTRPA